MAFLDEKGLGHLVNKIKDYVSGATVAKASTADKLTTGRNFKVSGVASGTSAIFNGTQDVLIPITGVKNTGVKWSTSEGDASAQVTPMGVAMVSNFNANRIAFMNPAGIKAEYSTDNGETWIEKEGDSDKIYLTTTFGANFLVGNKENSDQVTLNDLCRLTFTASTGKVYCNIRKIFIKVSTNGATNCKVKIEKALIGSSDTFTEVKTTTVAGWSGWNDINVDLVFGGNSDQTSQAAKLRFTFSIGGLNSKYINNMKILGMWFCGENGWNSPSELARTGHMYSILSNKSVVFQNDVKTNTKFVGDLTGTASRATADGKGQVFSDAYLLKDDYIDIMANTLVLSGGTATGNS